jgi:RNA polymerase sigma factor (sigma-70 family)
LTSAKDTYKTISDEELARKSRAGDERAFEALYDRYAKQLVNYFYRMLWHDREKAEDFTQDIFTKLAQKPELYDSSRPFKTWLFSVANNMCKNEYRAHEVRTKAANHLKAEVKESVGAQGGDNMDKASFEEKLARAIDGLDEARKQIMVLRFFDDLSIKEISDIVKCSEGTVKSRIFYTLQNLREQLAEFKGAISWLLIFLITN